MFKLFSIALLALWLSMSMFAQAPIGNIEDLGWMAGCWEINDPARNRMVSEQWMKPAGGTMIGMARTVTNGKTSIYEFTRVEERPDGIYYVAKPSQNNDETSFKLVRIGKSEAMFENPKHDFPQRIIYRRDGTKLNARIEGTAGSQTRGIDYPFIRSKCD